MKMKIKNKIRISSLLIILALAFTACEAGLVTDDSEGSGDSSSSGFSFSDLYTKISTLEDKISELQLQNTGMGGNMNDLMAPVGSIVAWHKTLGSVSIPAGWVE
ncbi:MAG: hypothetical protein GY754_11925, partial [bacterium]|nr:hypothetical protein [bacterium]